MPGIMSVDNFLQAAVVLVTVGLMALVGLKAPKWVFKALAIGAGLLLMGYSTSVLLVNIPVGIKSGSLPLLACFLGSTLWTVLLSMRFWETRSAATA